MSCRYCGNEFTMGNPPFHCGKVISVCQLCTELIPTDESNANCIFCGQSGCQYEIDWNLYKLLYLKCKIHGDPITNFCGKDSLVYCNECKAHALCRNSKVYNEDAKYKIKTRLQNFDNAKLSSDYLDEFSRILTENIDFFKEKINLLKEFLEKFISDSEAYKIGLIGFIESLRRLEKGNLEISVFESACFTKIFQFKEFCDEKKNEFFRTAYNISKNSNLSSVDLLPKKSIWANKAQAFIFDKIKETKKVGFRITDDGIYRVTKIFVGRPLINTFKGTFTYIKIYEATTPSMIIIEKTNSEVVYSNSDYFQEIQFIDNGNVFFKGNNYLIDYEYVGSEGYTAADKSKMENLFTFTEEDSLYKSRVFGLGLEESP